MKKIFALIIFLTALCGAQAQTSDNRLFAYPVIPDSITDFQARYDYFVSHFWDRANPKGIFSSKPRLAMSFDDYLSPLRFASADTVRVSIAKFMKSLEKQPNDMVYIAELAENKLYSDSAEIWSDELLLEFLRPVLANKRVSKEHKARYALLATQLSNTLTGKPMIMLNFTKPDGTEGSWAPRPGVAAFIFFNDPDCGDCNLARMRLKGDIRATELVDAGAIDIVAISPIDADENWKNGASSFPEKWIVGANPDLDMQIDLRNGTPDFYIVDENGNLLMKHANIDQILEILRKI